MSDDQRGQDVLKLIKASGHKKVKVAVADMDGVLRGKYIHIDKFQSAIKKGFGFCNVVLGWDAADVCYDNVEYAGWHTGYPDADVQLDPATYRAIPWEDKTPFLLGDFVTKDGGPLPICPRNLVKKGIADLDALGFEAKMGVEYEWFNFAEDPDTVTEKNFHQMKPISPGMFGYSLIRASYRNPYFHALMDQLESFNIPLEGLHTETGPGVYEAAIACAPALEAADRAVLMKTAIKEIAHRHGIVPTFMARWNPDLPGSSGHIHQSLVKKDDQSPVFFDSNDPYSMSPVFKSYLAGILKLLPHLLPMFAPTINSYKRLVEGFWAPTRALWGHDNRTTALRVIPGSEKSTRLEVRVGGADINPYLAIAACLTAGAYGIKQGLQLPMGPIKGNAYESKEGEALSSTLEEAANTFKGSEVAREILGDDFVDHFANTRLWEWRQHKAAVTDWELKRYFEII